MGASVQQGKSRNQANPGISFAHVSHGHRSHSALPEALQLGL